MSFTREEMIEKYATNKFEKSYIQNLGEDAFNQTSEVINFMEGDWETDEMSFQTILEQSLTDCVMVYDFITQDMLEERFPNVNYTVLHSNEANSDWSINQDNEGCISVKINMSNEHYTIMSLLGTLDELENYICDNLPLSSVVFVNNIDGTAY